MLTKRGVLIALEGCDKTGKSTHTKLLCDALKTLQLPSQLITFPDRSTAVGQIIDKYLTRQVELQDEAVHLLFSANRWELVPKIKHLLSTGTSVVLDRYAFSGVAFTSAKGIDLEWCKNPDRGLPKPDRVIYLVVNDSNRAGGELVTARADYGRERYENVEFQELVKEKFGQLQDNTWKIVETSRPKEEVHQEILQFTLDALRQQKQLEQSCLKSPLEQEQLWLDNDKLVN